MTDLGREELEAALGALGELLAARDLHYEVVLIGGGNLILRELVTRRTTMDLDVLGGWTPSGVEPMRPMPAALALAIEDIARAYGLSRDWLNLGPAAVLDLGLPAGFWERLERAAYGGLIVWLAARVDMICFKLYAAVDQGLRSRHLQDLRELDPTRDELLGAARWTQTQDPSPGYRSVLLGVLAALGEETSAVDLE